MELMSAQELTKWLRKQNPDQEYIWQDPVFCLLGHYLRANGSGWGERSYSEMPHYEEIAKEKPWTFGAALERAETLALPAPEVQTIESPRDYEPTLELTAEPALVEAAPAPELQVLEPPRDQQTG